jgi:signal transduction histidine kinase
MACFRLDRQNLWLAVKKYYIYMIVVAILVSVTVVALLFSSKNKDSNELIANTITVNTSSETEGNSNTATTKDLNSDNIINWTKSISATNNDVPMDGVIIEEIKPGQVYNGNMNLPKGWTAEFSTDSLSTPAENRTYSATEPADLTTVTYIKITTGEADGFKPYVNAPLVQPLDAQRLIADGKRPLAPILFKDKVFQIIRGVRAVGTTYYTMDCFDLTTYQRCTEVGFPTYFSTNGTSASPTALGTGARNISTAYNMQPVLEEDVASVRYGRMYFPGQSGNSYGVTCVDLINFTNCGFTVLGTSAEPLGVGNPTTLPYNPVLISGLIKNGTKLYGHANDADRPNQTVICFDMSTGASCTGFSSTTNTNGFIPTYYIPEHENSYGTPGTHVMVGDKLYWLVNYRVGNTRLLGFYSPEPQRDLGTRMACFDTVTRATCSGWTTPIVNTSGFGVERPLALYVWKKPGTATEDYAVCFSWGLGSGVDPVQSCRNPDTGAALSGGGNNVAFPGIFPQQWLLTPWTLSQYITTVTDDDGHLKSYFPVYKTGDNNTSALELNAIPTKGATICYDWTIQALCSGFSATKYWHDINDGYSGDVGYAFDGSCMWAVGYAGHIWSYNAETGETPCRVARTRYTATFNPDDYYCDATNKAFNWGKARLSKSSMYDFQSFDLVIKDTNGNIVKSANIKGNTDTLDLSDLIYDSNNPLTVEVNSSVYNTSPWANNGLPFINIVANADDYANNLPASDDVEYCYQTKVSPFCDINNVQTVSKVTITTPTDTIAPGDKTQTIPVVQESNEQCFKDLRVSIASNKNTVNAGEDITYTINIANKANKDSEVIENNRGNIPSNLNPKTARIEATLPAGAIFSSASAGGSLVGNKVIWENQGVIAAESVQKTVTLLAPTAVAQQSSPPSTNKVYAATLQQPLNIEAAVVYDDDVYQQDNTTSDNSVTYQIATPPSVSTSVSQSPIVAPASFSVTSNASDPGGSVTKIEILQNGNVVKTCLSVTVCTLSVTGYVAGSYSFSSKAYDNSSPELSATSNTSVVTVTPVPNRPPTTSITSSLTTAVAPADFTVNATASDDDGSVIKIEIIQNGNVAKTCLNSVQCSLDLANYTVGTYTYTSKAYDNANPAATASSSPQVVTITSPLADIPTINTPPNEAPNQLPTITLRIIEKKLTDPGSLTLKAIAKDSDGKIEKIVLYEAGEPIHDCGAVEDCSFDINNLKVGTYTYSARAWDEKISVVTSTQAIEILSVTEVRNGSGGASTSTNQNSRPTVSSIADVPEWVGSVLGEALDTTKRAAKVVPVGVATALPFGTIGFLLLFGFFYFYQAYVLKTSQKRLQELYIRFQQTKENRKNYIELTTHYLTTPITTMRSTVELMESLKVLNESILKKAKQKILKLADHANNILAESQTAPDESNSEIQKLTKRDDSFTDKVRSNKAMIFPIAGVLVTTVVLNVLFVGANKYSASTLIIIIQSSFFILGVVGIITGYNSLQKQRTATAITKKELAYEEEYITSQQKFIKRSSMVLAEDVAAIDVLAPNIESVKYGEKFKSGFNSLKRATSKIAYLELLTNGSQSKVNKSIPLNVHVDEVMKTQKVKALKSKVNLLVNVDPEISAVIDVNGFKYILISLIDNAIKFTKPGGEITLSIKNTARKYITVRVKDTGAGISKDKLDMLFKPFARGTDTLKFNYEGMGLDLYMDKLIVEQSGGKISIKSVEGAGTAITVKLPIK